MKVKLKLQTENLEDFELDTYEGFCSTPIIVNDTMIIGTWTASVYDMSKSTYDQLPEKIKKMMEERKTIEFYVKSSILTVTGLTAYHVQITIDTDNEKKKIKASKIFDNFDKKRGYAQMLTSCYFPSGSMLIEFQTIGEIFLEFDLEDVFILRDPSHFYEITREEYRMCDELNNQNAEEIIKIIEGKE